MKKPLLLVLLFILIITGLSVVRVLLTNRLSTTGIELEKLQVRVVKYKKENTLLNQKVLESSALINLSSKAKAMGFVESKSQVYLTNPLPLALR